MPLRPDEPAEEWQKARVETTPKTLHSLLGLLGDSGPIQKDKQKEPLDADLIIVDESSMIDMWLARQFFSRVRMGTRVILVGDVDQLQSVGAGDVFRELIDSGLIPVTVLNEISVRKKEVSLPITQSASMRQISTFSTAKIFSL